MGVHTLSDTAYKSVKSQATRGGTTSATKAAEEKVLQGKGLDPMVDPKGPAHLGPIRYSLPRMDKRPDGLWVLNCGTPMALERLLDTTGSMGRNVDIAFDGLPKSYKMLTSGTKPILGRYDVQIATANFNDVDDSRYRRSWVPVLCRSQFEMAEKIAIQMTLLYPERNGCGNGKEDSQFGLFAAAYFTNAAINRYGLKWYHLTISDEPIVPIFEPNWLKEIFGEEYITWLDKNGWQFDEKHLPDTAQAVRDLQKQAHAFFLQVETRRDVKDQWTELYGGDHVIQLPDGTNNLPFIEAVIIGLTEGVLDLQTAGDFLRECGVRKNEADQIIRAVAHIPLSAQTYSENFYKLPKAGDLFKEKTELWPIDPSELAELADQAEIGSGDQADEQGPDWL